MTLSQVKNGMSALQASRKYGVPSRTLYDKVALFYLYIYMIQRTRVLTCVQVKRMDSFIFTYIFQKNIFYTCVSALTCVQVKKMGILTANMQKQLQQKKGTEMEQKVQFCLEMTSLMFPSGLFISF